MLGLATVASPNISIWLVAARRLLYTCSLVRQTNLLILRGQNRILGGGIDHPRNIRVWIHLTRGALENDADVAALEVVVEAAR